MHVIIDTREQRPWSFPKDVTVSFKKLDAGDYALHGDNRFSIERKSVDDFVGTISTGWDRFVREYVRMNSFIAKVIIVEGTYPEFCFQQIDGAIIEPQHEHYRITPAFITKRIAQLALASVSVLFATNADYAGALALRLFIERQKQL